MFKENKLGLVLLLVTLPPAARAEGEASGPEIESRSFPRAWYADVMEGELELAHEMYERLYLPTYDTIHGRSADLLVDRTARVRSAYRAGRSLEALGRTREARFAYGWVLRNAGPGDVIHDLVLLETGHLDARIPDPRAGVSGRASAESTGNSSAQYLLSAVDARSQSYRAVVNALERDLKARRDRVLAADSVRRSLSERGLHGVPPLQLAAELSSRDLTRAFPEELASEGILGSLAPALARVYRERALRSVLVGEFDRARTEAHVSTALADVAGAAAQQGQGGAAPVAAPLDGTGMELSSGRDSSPSRHALWFRDLMGMLERTRSPRVLAVFAKRRLETLKRLDVARARQNLRERLSRVEKDRRWEHRAAQSLEGIRRDLEEISPPVLADPEVARMHSSVEVTLLRLAVKGANVDPATLLATWRRSAALVRETQALSEQVVDLFLRERALELDPSLREAAAEGAAIDVLRRLDLEGIPPRRGEGSGPAPEDEAAGEASASPDGNASSPARATSEELLKEWFPGLGDAAERRERKAR